MRKEGRLLGTDCRLIATKIKAQKTRQANERAMAKLKITECLWDTKHTICNGTSWAHGKIPCETARKCFQNELQDDLTTHISKVQEIMEELQKEKERVCDLKTQIADTKATTEARILGLQNEIQSTTTNDL